MSVSKKCWILLLACILLVIPFLGTYDYNTKGEPRESLVALNMLESGNWILPRNSVGEMAYKPPFFHWAVAATSAVAGEVNEFTSRMPSAVAFILLTVLTYLFFTRRSKESTALLTAAIVFTTYELHRQAFNCRVDMLLTFFIVAAMYGLYRWWEKGMRSLPLTAILMMSLGTLTKGPIGSLLPCLVMGVFMVFQSSRSTQSNLNSQNNQSNLNSQNNQSNQSNQSNQNSQSTLIKRFLKAFGWMALIGTLSLLLPALWYYAAWRQSGDEFITLMMEENVGRMTNTMSYQVHEGAWYMNLVYVVSGLLPWTLLLLFSLFSLSRKGLRSLPHRLSQWSPLTRYAATAVVVTLVFFTIPDCKRSVYLMPLYPFLAYLIARYIERLTGSRPRAVEVYGSVLSVLGLLVAVVFVALHFISVPSGLFHGRNAYDSAEMISNLSAVNGFIPWFAMGLLIAGCIYWWRLKRSVRSCNNRLYMTVVLTLALYLCFDATLKPAILNAKSVKHIARQIEAIVPTERGKLYEYIEEGVQAKGDPVHYYELNFYLHDRIGNFHTQRPVQGYLLIGEKDASLRLQDFQKQGYRMQHLYASGQEPVSKQILHLYRFERSEEAQK